MYRKTLLCLLVLSMGLFQAGNALCAGYRGGTGSDPFTPESNILLTPLQPLDEAETGAILKMREEEKLARDVYLTLFEKWHLVIFYDIAQSEQQHTDMVRQLIEKYQLTDPVTDDTVGVFTNPEFRELFDQLVAQGMNSVTDALKVGATIEDLDIKDLEEELAATDNYDIETVFGNLERGSYNHMRAFVGALDAYGESYSPQFISQEEFDSILSEQLGSGYGHRTEGDTMLPGQLFTFTGSEKASFTFEPTMAIPQELVGSSAQLYAFLYLPDQDAWYMFDAPDHGNSWTAGSEILPFLQVTLSSDTLEFPLFTQPLDLSEVTGTVYLYYGYRPEGGQMIYTFSQLVFE